jgi:hypothetical protein
MYVSPALMVGDEVLDGPFLNVYLIIIAAAIYLLVCL